MYVGNYGLPVWFASAVGSQATFHAVNVSVPEEFDGKLTQSIIADHGLKASASMVKLALLALLAVLTHALPKSCGVFQGLSKKHDISSEDNEVVKAGKEHLIKCLEVCAITPIHNQTSH